MRLQIVLFCVLVLASSAQAQVSAHPAPDRYQWSAAGGVSILTGTPHRPRPPEDNPLTGASGPEQGFHLRGAVERSISPQLTAGLEASYNRLTTSIMTLNCIKDPGSDSTGTCFPAAGSDEMLALHATLRAENSWKVAPFVTAGVGAGVFRLMVDEPFEESETLEDRVGVRPSARVGTGFSYYAGDHRIWLEGSFNFTIGRGGGTHHIPVVLGFSF